MGGGGKRRGAGWSPAHPRLPLCSTVAQTHPDGPSWGWGPLGAAVGTWGPRSLRASLPSSDGRSEGQQTIACDREAVKTPDARPSSWNRGAAGRSAPSAQPAVCRKGPRGVRGVKERRPQLRVLHSAGGSCRVASRPGASEPRLQNGDPAVAASRSREQVACHGAGRGVIPDPTGFPLFLRPFCSFPLSLSQTREVLSAREVRGFLSRINHFPKCPDSLQSWAVEAGKPEFYDSQHEALKSEGFSVLPRSPVRS